MLLSRAAVYIIRCVVLFRLDVPPCLPFFNDFLIVFVCVRAFVIVAVFFVFCLPPLFLVPPLLFSQSYHMSNL